MKASFRKAVCAAAAAMILCTACGDTGPAEDTHAQIPEKTTTSAQQGTSAAEETTAAKETESKETISETAADTENTSETLSPEALEKVFADFGVRLLKNDCEKAVKEGKNVLISPESVLTALGMTALGAEGDTSAEMQSVLAGGSDKNTMTEGLRRLASYRGKGVKMNRANSIWIKQTPDFAVKQSFSDRVTDDFGAECFCVPFDDKALEDINGWVNKNTDGMIPDIIDSIDPQTVMYLINAIAFDAEWDTKYEEDKVFEVERFYNSKGGEETCTMLRSKEHAYFSDGSAEAFIKLYKGGRYAFMGIRPNDGVSVSDYIDGLDGDKWYRLWNSRENEEVKVTMPEFTYDYESELSGALKAMGMELPFTRDADFTGITENNDIYISRVLHKTHIELDRKGTKAAAATAVEMMVKGAVLEKNPLSIELDHPFVYAIVNTETGFPVFLGAVNTVAK